MRWTSPVKEELVDRKLKRRLAIGGAVLVAVGAGGGAYAIAAGSNNEHDAYLNDVAGRLHVSRDQLDSALKGAFEDRLDAAVKAGKLTQAEADAIKKKVEQAGGAPLAGGPFLGKGPVGGPGPGVGFGFGFAFGKVGAAADDVAKYLGLTTDQLKQRIESGKSLADIAGDQKKSVDGLKQAIKDAAKKQLDSLVASKKITQEQENNALSKLDANIDNLVNLKPPNGKFHPRFKRGPERPAAPGGFFF
jgi:hypothetical protein